jgi:membrane-associated phospholipid phosphatase
MQPQASCALPGADLLGRLGGSPLEIAVALGTLAGVLAASTVLLAMIWDRFEPVLTRLGSGVRTLVVRGLETPMGHRILRRFPWSERLIQRRAAGGEFLGLRLFVGLVVSAAALTLFAKLAEDIAVRQELAAVDADIIQCLRSQMTMAGLWVWLVVTELGSAEILSAIGLGTCLWLIRRRQWYLVANLAGALLGGALLNLLLKVYFDRSRPESALILLDHQQWSFPSGHAMNSLLVYGMLAYHLWRVCARPSARLAVLAAAAFLVVAIGMSRLFLGVHYLTDVLGGYSAGTMWLAACIAAAEERRE